MVSMALSDGIYHRQSLIQRNGRVWNQDSLANSRALLCGAGNIGCPLAVALAQTGFGAIDILDKDVVSLPNLSRGVGIFRRTDLNKPKAQVLAARLQEINPDIQVQGIVADLRWDFGTGRFREYDIILLATHDLASRRHVNKFAHLFPGRTQAIIDGAIADLSFSMQTILPGQTPCYSCSLPPDTTDPEAYQGCNGVVSERTTPPAATNGIDGMAVAALMAKEAALLTAGLEPFFAGREFRFDGAAGVADVIRRTWRASCAEHRRTGAEEVVILPYSRNTRIAQLRKSVATRCGVGAADVRIFSIELMTSRLICDCGQSMAVMRPQQAPLAPVCPACANADPNHFRPELVFELDDPTMAGTLEDYGVPEGQALEAYIGAEHYYLLPTASEEDR